MNLIAAVDKNWGIGKNGRLLVNIPEDMKLFRQETMNKVVVMGRKTFESLPNESALVMRTNIVITSDSKFSHKGCIVVNDMDSLLEELKKYDTNDVYIIGGGMLYKEMLPYCDTAHITKIDYSYEADTYFPNLDKDKEWEVTANSDEHTYFDICYEFVRYSKIIK